MNQRVLKHYYGALPHVVRGMMSLVLAAEAITDGDTLLIPYDVAFSVMVMMCSPTDTTPPAIQESHACPTETFCGLLEEPDRIRNVHVPSFLFAILAASHRVLVVDPWSERRIDSCCDDVTRHYIVPYPNLCTLYHHLDAVEEFYPFWARDVLVNVTSAIEMCDGVVIVVDFAAGVTHQTETTIHHAISRGLPLVLFLNNLSAVLRQEEEPENLYAKLQRVIYDVNAIIMSHNGTTVSPRDGSVVFGDGRWGFTLLTFALRYSPKFQVSSERMVDLLWGESYFDILDKVWLTEHRPGLQRSFCQFVLGPIRQLAKAADDGDMAAVRKMLSCVLRQNVTPTHLSVESVLELFIPLVPSIMHTMAAKLPSPACDFDGPLVVQIYSMVPQNRGCAPLAFGRVISGTLRRGQRCRIDRSDRRERIQCIFLATRCHVEVDKIPCGGFCYFFGMGDAVTAPARLTG